MASNEGTCRNCGAPILWFKTEKQKNIPVDPEPVTPEENKDAKFVLDDEEPGVVFWVPQSERVGKLYVTHFDTCQHPDAIQRREENEKAWAAKQAAEAKK